MSRFDKVEQSEISKIAKRAISATGGGGGGVTDHGALTGLGDDDHTQYHNNARGDARYSQLGHTHSTGDVTGLDEFVMDTIGNSLDGGSTIIVTYDDPSNSIQLDLGSHQHDAGDITSGTINTARLGSGGTGSHKFLDGNNTWSMPFSIPRVTPKSTWQETASLMGDAFASAVMAASNAYYIPYRCHKSFTINAIGMNVATGVASSTAAVAIYDSDDDGWPIGAPLVSSGTITTTTIGDKSVAVSLTLEPGKQYWLGFQAGATPPNVRTIPITSLVSLRAQPNAANQFNRINHSGVTIGVWRNFTTTPVTASDINNGVVPVVFMTVV